MTRIRMGLVPGPLLVLALAVAACSGGDKTDGVASLGGDQATATTRAGRGQDERQAALNFARCMRQHGIDMPDPQVSGDDQQPPTGMRKDDPRLKAAEQACQQSGGGGK